MLYLGCLVISSSFVVKDAIKSFLLASVWTFQNIYLGNFSTIGLAASKVWWAVQYPVSSFPSCAHRRLHSLSPLQSCRVSWLITANEMWAEWHVELAGCDCNMPTCSSPVPVPSANAGVPRVEPLSAWVPEGLCGAVPSTPTTPDLPTSRDMWYEDRIALSVTPLGFQGYFVHAS